MGIHDTESVLTIGTVASRMGVSTHAVRLYEKEGLVHPKKSRKGQRVYSGSDVDLLLATRRLLAKGLNFAGIRRLYAAVPCHLYKPCCIPRLGHCTIQDRPGEPCWSIPDTWCRLTNQDCQACAVYRLASRIDEVREEWGGVNSDGFSDRRPRSGADGGRVPAQPGGK